MTGAPLPQGADAVIMVEDTSADDTVINCFKAVSAGENVRTQGEDVENKELVLAKHTVLRPQEIGMLAAIGKNKVTVFAPPRVAILATGNELVDASSSPGPAEIRNCNSYSLISLVRKYHAVPIDFGIIRDDKTLLRKALVKAAIYEMIITSGSVSVGMYDLVKETLDELGADMKFWRVRMKPGKPLAFGLIKDTPVFGLPGNPVSIIVSFEQFVRPALLKTMGHKKLSKPVITAIAAKNINEASDRVHLVRGFVTPTGNAFSVTTTGPQGSGILKSFIHANGLIIIPSGKTIKAGEPVQVMMFDWPEV
jgi:molybdopterin molybdotransferase